MSDQNEQSQGDTWILVQGIRYRQPIQPLLFPVFFSTILEKIQYIIS